MELKKRFLKIKEKLEEKAVKYFIVGLFGFLINVSLVFILTEYLKFYYLVSAIIVFFIVGILTFTLDKVWTFRENLERRFLDEYRHFLAFGILTFILNISVLYFLTNFFKIYYLFSQMISLLIVGAFGFVCNSIWTFRGRKR